MQDLTFEKIVGAVAMILVMIGAYNTIMTAIRNHREEKKYKDSPLVKLSERVERHDILLANDKKRIDDLSEHLKRIDEQSTIMLRSNRALLSHEINGNSVDKLKDSMDEIDNFLIARK